MDSVIKQHHNDKAVRDGYASRNLDKSFPELKEFLKQGSNVLDIGCGPGTITLDVAEHIKPGRVIGIDTAKGSIADARKKAIERTVANVEFKVANACDLPFDNEIFDVAYEHAVIKWLRDPVAMLEEAHRVIRPGGVLICTPPINVHHMFPPCPQLELVFEAWNHWADRSSENFVWDNNLGNEIVYMLREVGFKSVEARPDSSTARNIGGLSRFLLDEKSTLKKGYEYLFNLGVISPETLEKAREELKVFHSDESRYYCGLGLVAIARK